MTTIIILSAVALPCVFAFGFAVGHRIGVADGYSAHEDWCRRRCAK